MKYLFIVFQLVSSLASAKCIFTEKYVAQGETLLRPDRILLVTHAQESYDPRASAKFGVDDTIRYMKTYNVPVMYLDQLNGNANPVGVESPFYVEDCEPDYWSFSFNGEINFFTVIAPQVDLVGGHWEQCLQVTASVLVLKHWRDLPYAQDLQINFIMSGIYLDGDDLFLPQDSYYSNYEAFQKMNGNKLNLVEALKLIPDEKDQIAFLQRGATEEILHNLEHYPYANPPFYIQGSDLILQYKGHEIVLKKSSASHPYRFVLNYIEKE